MAWITDLAALSDQEAAGVALLRLSRTESLTLKFLQSGLSPLFRNATDVP